MDDKRYLVLTVDDDPCISRVVQLKLQNAGYDVIKAVTAEEGLAKIQEHNPDVIITDVKMPGMSGIDLCREVERLHPDNTFFMIVLTAQLDEDSRQWVESSPNRRFISKPFSPRKILSTIEEFKAAQQAECVA